MRYTQENLYYENGVWMKNVQIKALGKVVMEYTEPCTDDAPGLVEDDSYEQGQRNWGQH